MASANPFAASKGSSDDAMQNSIEGAMAAHVAAAISRASNLSIHSLKSTAVDALDRAAGHGNLLINPKAVAQTFEPMDRAASLTVKLNPNIELGRNELMKLLACMEAELQARDVIIATLKTERIKNMLQHGRVSANDPFLAVQRDIIGGRVIGGGNISQAELRNIEETQLHQLENLITQQRKAQSRMRHVIREAEKRHSWTVAELEKERRRNQIDCLSEETINSEDKDQGTLKQELDFERNTRKKLEKDLKKVHETLEEEKGKQKQIILMLVEERRRLALQYVEERKRSEDLAQILSEEKGRIDMMAEGLEEESKKSLQMEAELEKQLAEFDTERQQLRGLLQRKEERINELESINEKLQRDSDHYKKQLQEAHNVAMFQHTLSVSPPRLGVRPQIPVKPVSLAGQQRIQANPAPSNVTKAVQLTATVNSVPVTGPTTGIARGIQPGVGIRNTQYSTPVSDMSRSITTTAKSYSESDNSWTSSEPDSLSKSVCEPVRSSSSQVQSPRVSASGSSKVIATSHGKVTLHVTTAPLGSSQTPNSKKPLPPTRSATISGPTVPKAPPIPPNKPTVPPKKDVGRVVETPISVEVKPQKVGAQTVKFGITISKTGAAQPTVDEARREAAQVPQT